MNYWLLCILVISTPFRAHSLPPKGSTLIIGTSNLAAEFATTPITSSNKKDATITITTITGGTAPYFVKLDKGAFQRFMGIPVVFSGLDSDIYTIIVKDAQNAEREISVPVETSLSLAITFFTQPITYSNEDGILVITNITGGTAPYQVAVDKGALQPFTGLFIERDLTAGEHSIAVYDRNNCETIVQAIVETQPHEG
ncbi:hypothetical protein H0W26_04375 [Candidatus Dependentiae bacterium]|nr:hypothetical protein [Candidatus Dependentiae bacterium]